MVRDQIAARGVREPRVLDAMRRVPRHLFVPEALRAAAYEDSPLPIGHGQTISQPFIVAWMTEALQVTPQSRVLEIGTGSGYQAAVLSLVVADVYTIEIVAPLAESARHTLESLGYTNVHAMVGDGYAGWPEHAPFDAIIVTAAPDHVPQPLIDQLRVGGRLVVPVGGRGAQQMTVITRQRRRCDPGRADAGPVRAARASLSRSFPRCRSWRVNILEGRASDAPTPSC